ncbi:hypothetical protein U9M48_009803 [Paspalum notatum var. saurae]|uniref:Retrotransposon gag domain-containing protein n=1 Tax=Paspalum notatum var. saurae TaxID=547442 RepID=A0AAQ3SS43_PASNO
MAFNWGNRRKRSNAPPNEPQNPPPPPENPPILDPMQMMQMHNQVLQNLAQVTTNLQNLANAAPHPPPPQQQHEGLKRFMFTKPPSFTHAVEPMEADDWLQTIESKLDIAHCEGHDRVLFAAHQLHGQAHDWWVAYTAAHPEPQEISWREFRRSFREHFVPKGEIKGISLFEARVYVRAGVSTKFTQLSRYAPDDVDEDGKKQDCFREGPNPGLRYALSSNDYRSFRSLLIKPLSLKGRGRFWMMIASANVIPGSRKQHKAPLLSSWSSGQIQQPIPAEEL